MHYDYLIVGSEIFGAIDTFFLTFGMKLPQLPE